MIISHKKSFGAAPGSYEIVLEEMEFTHTKTNFETWLPPVSSRYAIHDVFNKKKTHQVSSNTNRSITCVNGSLVSGWDKVVSMELPLRSKFEAEDTCSNGTCRDDCFCNLKVSEEKRRVIPERCISQKK